MTAKLPGSVEPPADLSDPPSPAPDPTLSELPPKHQRFVLAYIDCGNAAEACRRAGYKPGDPHAASVEGARLLANAGIAKAVRAIKDADARRAHLSRDQRLAILAELAQGRDPAGGCPPSVGERLSALGLLFRMVDPPQRQAIDLESRMSYVVELPRRIDDPVEWTAWAAAEMKRHDAATTHSNVTAATSGRSIP